MAEAEDVILHAVEQASTAAAALWRRRPAEQAPGIALADVSRRLSVLIQACLGRTWPLLPVDPEATPSWLARRLRKLPPWTDTRHAQAFSDGLHIFLPRRLHIFADTPGDASFLRLMALMLAARLGRDSVARCPTQPVARDLFWAVDGAVVEGFLAVEFPGLAMTIAAARRLARASRPSLDALSPRERAMELVVQRLLEVALSHVGGLISHPPPNALTARDLAQWATWQAAQPPFHDVAPYRGVAPVLHWATCRQRGQACGQWAAAGSDPLAALAASD
jgi:hypothetical protein